MTETGFVLAGFKERFREVAAGRQIPGAMAETFLATLRPRVALHERANDGGVVFRYGGLPRLPADVGWPAELTFLGALDCAAIPRDQLDLPYPESGELLFFWDGSEAIFSEQCRVIHVPDPSIASEHQPPAEHIDVHERADYYATPEVEAPGNSGYYAYDALCDIAMAVGDELATVHSVFALGGYPNGEDAPEWWMAQEPGRAGTDEEREQLFDRLRDQCRVLLSTGSDPAEDSRLRYLALTPDLAAGRFETVTMTAHVND
ncbi:DUF1963 domain-containing protein [Actinoplanes sp. NPDC051494]|uniref:DUF1963 domain-containing protein n=1 Tax=Actinoplanes sp. NPDC051494 TaxID=3363907 RepID=UPI0037B9B0F8